MSTPFIFPTITSLPPGYDCTVSIPIARLMRKVIRNGVIRSLFRVFQNGKMFHAEEHTLSVEGGQARGGLSAYQWRDHAQEWGGEAGFLEVSFRADDAAPMFTDTRAIGFYAIYSKPGKKSFFSDNAFRYGSPPIINQIAAFGRYIDAYPVVHLSRKRDLGETLTLINPYEKPILATITTDDRREIRRRRVESNSVLNIRLIDFLRDDEDEWIGQIQLTATNRLVTFHIKHSLADPQMISDHEHLDPFRSDKTHYPLSQIMRLRFGEFLRRHGWRW